MDYKKLLNCVNGTEGDELLSWYANCTKSLKQRLRGVPETRYGPDMVSFNCAIRKFFVR